MKFQETSINGVWEIEFDLIKDDRGTFRRHFCEVEFKKRDICSLVRQTNISENTKRGTLRGFHFQKDPHWEPKTVSCLRGNAHSLIVDLRPDSKTFKKWIPFVLDSRKPVSVHVPMGCAMAWITLEDDTHLHYYMGDLYYPELSGGIRYNDPQFKFVWPFEPVVISEKDRTLPDYKL